MSEKNVVLTAKHDHELCFFGLNASVKVKVGDIYHAMCVNLSNGMRFYTISFGSFTQTYDYTAVEYLYDVKEEC